jgi:hypothetical protein
MSLLVQNPGNAVATAAGTGSIGASFTSTTGGNSLVLAAVAATYAFGTAPTPPSANWTQLGSTLTQGADCGLTIWTGTQGVAFSGLQTWTLNGASKPVVAAVILVEISACTTTTDGTNHSSGTGTSASTGQVSTTFTTDVLCEFFCSEVGVHGIPTITTPGGGYSFPTGSTQSADNSSPAIGFTLQFGYQIPGTSGNFTGTAMQNGSNWLGWATAFVISKQGGAILLAQM